MNSLSKERSGIALLLIPLLAVGGCAHRMPRPVPSEADRATLRTVGIASATYIPEISFLVPAKGAGQGALIGTGTGFAASFRGLAGAGPYGIVVAAAIGVVLAPFGAMIGAANAMPLEEARSSETALRKALAELKIQESLRDRLTAGSADDSPIFTEIDSLQPTLRWESFPRPSDLHADRQGLIKAALDVSYELRIWRVEDNSAIRRVYERRELTSPKHRLDVRLDPNARYFWSVRAKFRAGEETRVIPWGFSKVPSVPGLAFCITPGNIPHANYYRFQTPAK